MQYKKKLANGIPSKLYEKKQVQDLTLNMYQLL